MFEPVYVGIDPDLRGGIAVVCGGRLAMLRPIPVRRPENARHDQLDVPAMLSLAEQVAALRPRVVAVEAALVRPQRGKDGREAMTAHVGRTHQTRGALWALAHVMCPVVRDAHPSAWKRVLRVTSDKGIALDRASQEFPSHASVFSLKKHAGLAEAALIALYARRSI